MLVLEECRLRLCGNSDSGKIGLPGWQCCGGVIAHESTTGSVVSLVNDHLAAALVVVVQRCLNTSIIEVASAEALALCAFRSSGLGRNDRWGEEKREKRSQMWNVQHEF
jgi:hypothetical protein